MPDEIDEAAQVEGASPWRILRDITIPLALPSIIGAGLFSFMLSYSEFLFALFITTTRERRTLPVILGALSANTDVSWNMLMASITIGIIPTLLLAIPGLALHGARPDQRGGTGVVAFLCFCNDRRNEFGSFIWADVFPDSHNSPSRFLQSLINQAIPLHIPIELWAPIGGVGSWRAAVLGTSMPETSINKHGDRWRVNTMSGRTRRPGSWIVKSFRNR